MSVNQAVFPIAAMARVLGVSEAGYHAWRQRAPSVRTMADAALLKQIRTAHAGSGETYGAPRVHATLAAQGARHGRKRIARLMREAGLVGVSRRRGGVVTTRRDREARPAPDLVDRNFSAEAPNQLWVGDITFVPTAAASTSPWWSTPGAGPSTSALPSAPLGGLRVATRGRGGRPMDLLKEALRKASGYFPSAEFDRQDGVT